MGNGSSTSLLLDNVTVNGQTAVHGGNGADSVRAVDSNLAGLLIQTGLGSDTVRLEGVHATGRVRLGTGFGKDLVAVSDSTFGGPVTWVGGATRTTSSRPPDPPSRSRSTWSVRAGRIG